MHRTASIALTLSSILVASAAAEWLPGDAGDRQHFTRTVVPSTVTIQGVTSGDEVGARIVSRQGGWRLWSDFAGLGPRWVHSGQGDAVYLYDGLQARLLANLGAAPGYTNTLQVIDLSDGVRVESWLRDASTEVRTRKGTFDCAEVLLTVYFPDNTVGRRTLCFADGVGLVRWTDDKNPYDYNVFYQPVFVQHDLEPAPLALGRVDLPGAVDAVRVGDRAFVARGALGVSVVDLARGAVERTVAVPAERVFREGDGVLVHGPEGGATAVHRVSAAGAPLRLPFDHPVLPLREGGLWGSAGFTRYMRLTPGRLDVLDDQGAHVGGASFSGALPSGRFGGTRGPWGVHYLPLGPDGVVRLEVGRQPSAQVEAAPAAAHDVQLLNGAVFVATDAGLLHQTYTGSPRPTRAYTTLVGEPVGQLRVSENRLWALTREALLELDDRGQVLSRSPLSGFGDLSSMRHGLLDVQRGRALLLLADRGLEVVAR